MSLTYLYRLTMKIDIYSHCFVVSQIENRFESLIRKLLRLNVESEVERDPVTGASYTVAVRTWAFTNQERSEYNLHIHYLPQLLGWVETIPDLKSTIEIIHHEVDKTTIAKGEFRIKSIHDPRDYQRELIDLVVPSVENNFAITLPPGAGKTLTAMHIMSQIKDRTLCIMKGGYIDRWVPELEDTFDLRDGRMMVVRGQKDLITLMEMQVEGSLTADIIMMTIDTLETYIKDYQQYSHIRARYPYSPMTFMSKMGIGLTVLDEGHQNPHKVTRVFCHTHIAKFLTLSATLETKDPFLNERYRILYPEHQRHNAGYKNIYIGVNALMYRIEKLKGIRTTGYKGSYNHVQFEQSLLKGRHRKTLAGYMGLVKYSIDLKFMDDYRKDTKCLLFFATINMCDHAVKYIKSKYPHLKVVRYTAKDKMSVLDDADIIISTVLSAGTAVDIVNLRTTIMTTAIDSQIANEQSLGRTRPVKAYPELTPEFCYFVCLDIPKQLQYHRNKKQVFDGLVKYHTEITLPYAA